MKLVLNGIGKGLYNDAELHAFIQIEGDKKLAALDPIDLCKYLNAKVLPTIKLNFKEKSYSIHEFGFDCQGAPLSLRIASNTAGNNISLEDCLQKCLDSSNKTLSQIKTKPGLFRQAPLKESDVNSNNTSPQFS